MRYLEWVERILRVILDEARDPAFMFGYPQIAERVGLGRWDNPQDRARDHSLDAAITDLDNMGLLLKSDTYNVVPELAARRFKTHPLSELYPRERKGHLEADEETFLAKLAELSEVEHDEWTEIRRLRSTEVFDALGWPWDRTASLRICATLKAGRFAHVHSTNDMDNPRLAFAGAVRVRDEPTMILAEARDQLALGRYRAAGCVAGVELERGLRDLAAANSLTLTTDPGISAYNDLLKGKGYDKATWRRIQALGDLRNLCAHVLDHEPTRDEATRLVDGVDDVLRALG